MTRYASVPVCDLCWRERDSQRAPQKLAWPVLERCGLCGHVTASGIYVRAASGADA